ncbi:MAG TPA: hypothetical protein VJ756_14875 [Terriglobales bacterium]|jgi:hypothetical protein|nr:hypothetical protein [Terriglobales bacterium]
MSLLAPLAVLVLLALFGFAGCAAVLDVQDVSYGPTYVGTIKSENSLVAHWRLGEPVNTPVPSSGTAIDEKGAHNGNYNKATITADPKRFSPPAPGNITLGIKPGLLDLASETGNPCIEVNGGFVEVPFDAVLNPSPFTFEAWVIAEFGSDPQNRFYCLVESSAPAGGVQKKFGFGLYAGPANPASAQAQPYQWQVWMGDGQKFTRVAIANDNVNFNQLTYLALTYDPGAAGNNLFLYHYYPDTNQDCTLASCAPIQATVGNFKQNNQVGGGSLLIGMGRNLFPGVQVDPVPLQPFLYAFKGKIQEAAVYNAALKLERVASHMMAGGKI